MFGSTLNPIAESIHLVNPALLRSQKFKGLGKVIGTTIFQEMVSIFLQPHGGPLMSWR